MPVHAADRRDFVPTDEQAAAAERFVDFVDRYGMHTPAIVALEASKPMNRVASVMALMAAPSVSLLFGTQALQHLGQMLDDRRALEYVLRRLEERI